MSSVVVSWLATKIRKNFACSRARKSTKSSCNVQPDDAVIVNTQQPNLPIDIGFAARQKSREHHSEKTN